MNISRVKMNPTFILVLLACAVICVKAAPRPQSKPTGSQKPTVPGIDTDTGFSEIVVESSLNVRTPDKRQSKTPRLVIPHMIPKKFGEGGNSKHTSEELSDKASSSTTTSTGKPSKTAKKVSTTSTTEKPETTTE